MSGPTSPDAQHNICNLTLSSVQLMGTLSEDVLYSCLYWIDHVCAVLTSANNVWNRVQSFLALHLLHWFEAMSILKRSRDTIKLLQDLVDWIEVSGPILLICSHLTLYIFPNQPSELVHDACRFAEAFHDTIPYHPLCILFSFAFRTKAFDSIPDISR